jgi:hypothetical protein
MNKYFTFSYSVESSLKSKLFYSSNLKLNLKSFDKAIQFLATVRLSPSKEVINNILKHTE